MKTSTTAAVATSILLSGVRAQYTIDPQSVSKSTREFWCQQQITQCPLICLDQGSSTGSTEANECDSDALTYACVCDDGRSPNVSEYSNTLPYSLCTEWGSQCVSNCNGDPTCAEKCRSDHPCGAQNPTRQNTSTLTQSSTAAPSGTGSQSGSNAQVTTDSDGSTVTVYNGFGSSGQTTQNENGGVSNVRVWALGVGQTFGTLSIMGLATLGFAVLL
ncbi:hypothetical protein CB0940_04635 [Cercospora beticola]|uniref:DUF7707 domain-containing protein n=1 Tax=Cercospora beticola TaxID=122368 RepID=A0A2G5HLE9_CERBT|nr:hypothetical protein CB0940_04635 [Cercospora beticola]XP_023452181.1 hypothetical protein CB0940_04635 [Cercospora beticola]PIA93053.1 hypothetical protein CB0940_04635 [Cercospora beticola]PIA93054.1 hypothetical protein CB0940_04635 [Cercospora beticola]WPB01894.1 hypothetical protein RHO25_006527 [Cercospora beticola]CAK1363263.1 unnamed protein product [Cercospora beticola]